MKNDKEKKKHSNYDAIKMHRFLTKTITLDVNYFCLKSFSVLLLHDAHDLCAFFVVLHPFFAVPQL